MTRYFHFLWPRYDVIITPFTDQLMTSIFCLFYDQNMTWFLRHLLTNKWRGIFQFSLTTLWRGFHVIFWPIYDNIFLIFFDHVMTWLSRQLLINKWRDFFHFLRPRYDVIITSSIDQLMTSIFCLFMTRIWRDFYVIYWQVSLCIFIW